MTNGASNGTDLAFRDRVVEFIGTTSSTVKSVQKEIKEIKESDKDAANKNNERLTKIEEKLTNLKVEYTITKTKVAIWGVLASASLVTLIKVGGWIMKIFEAVPK